MLKFDEKVTLYANESYDPNGDLLTYKWRSNIDGLFGEGEIIIEIILSLGKHNITLEVADGFHTSFDYLEIIVFKPGENDTDGDSYPDDIDAFPNDPTQWQDSDGDGYGDNLSGNNPDLFPDNVTEWADTDGDGYGDNSDAYPNDPTKYELEPGEEDSDGDGHPDSTDAFPYDPNEWIDTDGDGVGDNSDAYPNDPNRYKKETTQDYLIEIILITSVIIILIIIISLKLFIQRPKRQRLSKTDFDDEMLNTVRHKILHGETLQELEYSRDEIEGMLDRKFKAGNISIHTYNLIKKEILCSDEAQFGQMNNSKLRGKE